MNDYISREALFKELISRDFYPVIVRRAIESIPAADVRPVVRAEWSRINDPECIWGDFECTSCGHIEQDVSTAISTPGENCYYYCPNCGARMTEGGGTVSDDNFILQTKTAIENPLWYMELFNPKIFRPETRFDVITESPETLAKHLLRAQTLELSEVYCKNLSECLETDEDIPEERCLQCLIEYLNGEAGCDAGYNRTQR